MLAVPFVRLARTREFIQIVHFHPSDGVARLGQRAAATGIKTRFHRLQISAVGGDFIGQNVEFQYPGTLQKPLQIIRAGDRILTES